MTLVASDLDQTLIYSKRSLGTYPGRLVLVETVKGEPVSYVSEKGLGLLAELFARTDFVAVTTRDVDQVLRVELPFRKVLCANGAVLLEDGVRSTVHDEWAMTQAASSASLDEVLRLVPTGDWVRSHRVVADLFLCVVAHAHDAFDEVWLSRAEEWAERSNWVFSRQGRKAYLVPQGLDKGSALLRAKSQWGTTGRVLTAGDSVLDVPLLRVGDEAVRPGHGELETSPHLVPAGVEVLPERGLLAGDRIVEWFLERC